MTVKILFYGGSWLGPPTLRALIEIGHEVVFEHEVPGGISAVVSAGWHAKLPPFLVDRAINLHPSPLPLFKGKQPLLAQQKAGVRHTALTIHEMTPEFDSGPILVQRWIPLSEGWTLDEAGDKIRAVLKGCLQAALTGPGGV
jgi:methionyl-tRNA formyltransferase